MSNRNINAGPSGASLNGTNLNGMGSGNVKQQPSMIASGPMLTLGPFKQRKDMSRELVISTYQIMGYIAAGTYGKVYKARYKKDREHKEETDESTEANTTHLASLTGEAVQLFAVKKFKSDNHLSSKSHQHDIHGNEIIPYTGILQSAIREMLLCRELRNEYVTRLVDIVLENKSIYMVFEFCEHDLLQIIHHHLHPESKRIPDTVIKLLIWQVLNGVTYLHQNWIFHRDLKPANIMVLLSGVVKIGDLGLARKFNNPLQSLYTGDKVVVTIWYRAPELLLGARHYSPAIDLWAVGCILAELLLLRPAFKGEEAKIDANNKKLVPFQKNQFEKIMEILGTPTVAQWPALPRYPEYALLQQALSVSYPCNLETWYASAGGSDALFYLLLKGLLEYDPQQRLTAEGSLMHRYFSELPKVQANAFEGLPYKYPKRRIYTDDNDILSVLSLQGYKRQVFDDMAGRKRHK